MTSPSPAPRPIEDRYRAQAVAELLEQITSGTDGWWNHPWVGLGGRTPSQALADGDLHDVEGWIRVLYRRNEEAVARHRGDPGFLQMIEAKRAALRLERSA